MTQSRQALVNRALFHLRAKPLGRAAAAELYSEVDDSLEAMLSSLATRNVWQWGDPDQIDDDAFETLARLLANLNASGFGGAYDEGNRRSLEGQLRELSLTSLSGQPQRAEYF